MQIVVLTSEEAKEELLAGGLGDTADIRWAAVPAELQQYTGADAFIDLLFEPSEERLQCLGMLLPRPVLVNSVEKIAAPASAAFIRINGWPTLLGGADWEAFAPEFLQAAAEGVAAQFNKRITWLPNEHGFITPRVISMIINEAYLACEEGVSTPEEINTAMKLGTNYPYGPFEWAQKIGVDRICSLLRKLGEAQPRYAPAASLHP